MLLRLTRWAVAITVATAPLYVVRWHVGAIPTTLLEVLILGTIALYALTLLRSRAPLPGRTPLDIPIAVMLVAGIVGVFVAADHRGALGIFRAYLVEPIAVYYIAVAVLNVDVFISQTLPVWAAGALLFSLDELATFARAVRGSSLDPDNVAAALGINANSVSLYLDPLIGVAAGLALFTRGRLRASSTVVLVLLLLADVATLSRGGLVAIAVLALIAITTTQEWRRQIALLLVVVATGFLITRLPIIGPRLGRAFNPAFGTFVGRGRIWAATLRMLRDHPVFGAGMNAYETTMAPYRAADPNLVPEPYPHNIFLTTWSELGVLGLAAFAYILFRTTIWPWVAIRNAVAIRKALLWGTTVAFAMIVAHGLVDSPYWKNDLSVEFWFLAAIQLVAFRSPKYAA